MEMPQTHCHATATVTLLWKCHKLIAMQQQLLRYYGNATGRIGHAAKETQHVTILLGYEDTPSLFVYSPSQWNRALIKKTVSWLVKMFPK
jgi:hypothetical protein